MQLIQSCLEPSYSNLQIIHLFLTHIDEFEQSRLDEEKDRQVLSPKEINSLFDVFPVDNSFILYVDSLELFISKLQKENKFRGIFIGIDKPYISIWDSNTICKIYLKDTKIYKQLNYFLSHCINNQNSFHFSKCILLEYDTNVIHCFYKI